MLIALKNKFSMLFIIIFGTISFPIDRYLLPAGPAAANPQRCAAAGWDRRKGVYTLLRIRVWSIFDGRDN